MPSLKEIKNRIASVNSTRKITSAMKMVASSKLHHAQVQIERMLPYESMLEHILKTFIASDADAHSIFEYQREVKRVALLVFASNSSLCGRKRRKHRLRSRPQKRPSSCPPRRRSLRSPARHRGIRQLRKRKKAKVHTGRSTDARFEVSAIARSGGLALARKQSRRALSYMGYVPTFTYRPKH